MPPATCPSPRCPSGDSAGSDWSRGRSPQHCSRSPTSRCSIWRSSSRSRACRCRFPRAAASRCWAPTALARKPRQGCTGVIDSGRRARFWWRLPSRVSPFTGWIRRPWCGSGLVHVMEGRRVPQYTVEQNLIIGGHMFPSAGMRQALERVYEAILMPGRTCASAPRAIFRVASSNARDRPVRHHGPAQFMLIDEPPRWALRHAPKRSLPCCTHCARKARTADRRAEHARGARNHDYGYVMESGRIVLEGQAQELRDNEDVREFLPRFDREGARKSPAIPKHYSAANAGSAGD